ncbi:MAG: glycosyltransferase family 2 protein, partial [Promicromonosporaceae bacterium]|nr:glycosyltransferase family 2 protein [Promicromonosporaceae bacterium]
MNTPEQAGAAPGEPANAPAAGQNPGQDSGQDPGQRSGPNPGQHAVQNTGQGSAEAPVPPAGPGTILVAVVVYHPGEELRRFADSLASATSRPYHLVFVNNGGPSPVLDSVAADHSATVLRHREGNVGYGRAANLAARSLPGDPGQGPAWLVVANPDIEWSAGSLDRLIEAGQADPTAGSLGPRLRNEDGSIYPSARALPRLGSGIGHALFARAWPGNPWTARYQQGRAVLEASAPTAAGWLSGACLLLRPAAFAEVDGFDERYFMFFEDVDLGDRLGRAGWRNLYVPNAEAIHTQGVSWRAAPARMIRAHHASARRYLLDRHPPWYQGPL